MKNDVTTKADEGQELDRRDLFGGRALLRAAAVGMAGLDKFPKRGGKKDWNPFVSEERPFLLSIFLRGGMDGLSCVCPYGDQNYIDKRSATQINAPGSPTNAGLALTPNVACDPTQASLPDFCTAPALAPLKQLFDEGKLAFVHATGSVDDERSHFDQMQNVESGTHSATPSQDLDGLGWIGRHLQSTAPLLPGWGLRAIGISPFLADSLLGNSDTLPVPDPSDYQFPGDPATASLRQDTLQNLYDLFGDPLQSAYDNVVGAVGKLKNLDFEKYQPAGGAAYPGSDFGTQLKQAAQMAKELAGLEVVHVDKGGWDTHSGQGVFDGQMAGLMGDLAQSILAFVRDMSGSRKFLVFVTTEFGRTLDENSSAGTDHGRGGVAIVCGEGVVGRRILGTWPGLDPAALDGGDLAVANDIRDVMSEVVRHGLQNDQLDAVFPDATYTPAPVHLFACPPT